jgi:hypothetical protein
MTSCEPTMSNRESLGYTHSLAGKEDFSKDILVQTAPLGGETEFQQTIRKNGLLIEKLNETLSETSAMLSCKMPISNRASIEYNRPQTTRLVGETELQQIIRENNLLIGKLNEKLSESGKFLDSNLVLMQENSRQIEHLSKSRKLIDSKIIHVQENAINIQKNLTRVQENANKSRWLAIAALIVTLAASLLLLIFGSITGIIPFAVLGGFFTLSTSFSALGLAIAHPKFLC